MKATKKNPKLNVKLLRKIQRRILEEPLRINMSEFIETDKTINNPLLIPPCGTTGCIAGWALLETGVKPAALKKMFPRNIAAKAAKRIGVSYLPSIKSEIWGSGAWNSNNSTAVSLFDLDEWPEKFAARYGSADDALFEANSLATVRGAKTRMAKAVVARIEHFIKTGK